MVEDHAQPPTKHAHAPIHSHTTTATQPQPHNCNHTLTTTHARATHHTPHAPTLHTIAYVLTYITQHPFAVGTL